MTDAAMAIAQADVEALMRSYTFREPQEVWEFLGKYPFIVPVLLEAPEKIKQYFPDSHLSLRVEVDPEIIDWVQLILSIQMTLDPYEATARENLLDKDWWLNVPHEVRRQVCTLLEYPDDF